MAIKQCIFLFFVGVLIFLPFMHHNGPPENEGRCIFCDIANGKRSETLLYVDEADYVIFADIRPASTHHFLVVPKRHIESVKTLTRDDQDLLDRMESGLHDFLKEQGINVNETMIGFHIPPFISVKHLHMHAIAPISKIKLSRWFGFKPNTFWFKKVDEIRRNLPAGTI